MVDILLAGLLVAMLIAVGVSQRTQGVVKPVFPLSGKDSRFLSTADESERSGDPVSD